MTPEEKLKDLKVKAEYHLKEYERLKKEWEDNKPKSSFFGDWGKLSINELAEFDKVPDSEWKKHSDYYDRLIGENSEPEFHLRNYEKLVDEMYELSEEIRLNRKNKD